MNRLAIITALCTALALSACGSSATPIDAAPGNDIDAPVGSADARPTVDAHPGAAADAHVTTGADARPATPDAMMTPHACTIAGASYQANAVDPTNACLLCDPSRSTTAWSMAQNGSACGSGDVCGSGECVACAAGSSCPPANPCDEGTLVCSTGMAVCHDTGHAAGDGASCGEDEVCHAGSCESGCFIGGTVYAGGASDPQNPCQSCQPAASTTVWSATPDGASCGTGLICQAGTCAAACEISGTPVSAGTVDVQNQCLSCQPGLTTSSWSQRADGTSCGGDQLCKSGSCGAFCEIGGATVAAGAKNPSNSCQTCQNDESTTSWSNLANGASCGAGEICHSGSCAAGCVIGDAFFATNAVNPNNPCQVCAPATSTSAWSDATEGQSCGNGQICQQGSCGSGCTIDGVDYSSGAANPSNSCQSCQPASSTNSWTGLADATSCGNGSVCVHATCMAGCYIGGFEAPGMINPASVCQVCNMSMSETSWTNISDGADCGNGDVCTGGACKQGCYIDGQFHADGANPGNSCQVCDSSKSLNSWSNGPDGTTCGGGLICQSGSCASACDIGGQLYSAGAANPNNACQTCQPATSTSGWTALSPDASCGAGSFCEQQTCESGCEIAGSFVAANTVNPDNACQTCQPAMSATLWSNVTDGNTCGGDGMICVSGTCSLACRIGGSDYTMGQSNPSDACQVCQPASSATNWSSANDGTSCGNGGQCGGGTCKLPDGQACTSGNDCVTGVCNNPGNGLPEQCGCKPGWTNPQNPCQACDQNGTSWDNMSDGTSCGSGVLCQSGSCVAGCYVEYYVSGTEQTGYHFYAPGTVAAPPSWTYGSGGNSFDVGLIEVQDCNICDPSQSTTYLSMMPTTTPCGINAAFKCSDSYQGTNQTGVYAPLGVCSDRSPGQTCEVPEECISHICGDANSDFECE